MSQDRFTHEQRKVLRGQIDQARRAQRLGAARPPTELQQTTADEIAVLLASDTARLFSIGDMCRALNCKPHRVTPALVVLESQERATPVQAGRYMRWKAPARRV